MRWRVLRCSRRCHWSRDSRGGADRPDGVLAARRSIRAGVCGRDGDRESTALIGGPRSAVTTPAVATFSGADARRLHGHRRAPGVQAVKREN